MEIIEDVEDERDAVPRWLRTLIPAALVVFALLSGFDIMEDFEEGATIFHVSLEASMAALAAVAAALEGNALLKTLRHARRLEDRARRQVRELAEVRRRSEAWRLEASDLMAGVAQAIDGQLDRWGLTPAEKETALLLLKGLSHREIGDIRSVSEATARQQSRAVYKKAGLGGRHDLAAFFLEDLLVPAGARAEKVVAG